MEWKVGQEVYYVPFHRRDPARAYTIEKIGRKWVTVNGYGKRFDKDTGAADNGGYGAPGRYWPSRAEHDAYLAKARAWEVLWKHMSHRYCVPEDMTIERIQAALDALGVPRE